MINRAEKILKYWHQNLGSTFGQKFYRHVAHQILHLPQQARLHGSPLVHSCFFGLADIENDISKSKYNKMNLGESCIGKIVGLVSCSNVALKQMKERITNVHSNYSELDERDIQLYSNKGRKPADADCYSGGDLSLFGDDVCCYIRYVRGQI